uniref:Uncharacterized protein n=1 Tax=Oryza nivara TaxID=4536 RepID=A0A0E0H9I9_ORYNI
MGLAAQSASGYGSPQFDTGFPSPDLASPAREAGSPPVAPRRTTRRQRRRSEGSKRRGWPRQEGECCGWSGDLPELWVVA